MKPATTQEATAASAGAILAHLDGGTIHKSADAQRPRYAFSPNAGCTAWYATYDDALAAAATHTQRVAAYLPRRRRKSLP